MVDEDTRTLDREKARELFRQIRDHERVDEAREPGRRVLPKATTLAWVSPSSGTRRKNSISFGLEPGQPPSM